MTGNFHRNSDVNRLYLKRAEGGRGLKSFEQMFISRIVLLKRHIAQDRDKNHYLENIYEHEKKRIVRLGEGIRKDVPGGVDRAGKCKTNVQGSE